MKHLLNNLSSDEKNNIREQYEGGMSIDTSKFKKLLETKLGDAKPLINEDETVSDLERKQLSDKMIKDIVDKYYLDDVVNPTTKVPYQPFNNGGKLDYNKAYRDNMESIDQKLSELGFPNGVHIPENISRQEFDDLKVKWDQASSRLTESGLARIVKRVINEDKVKDDASLNSVVNTVAKIMNGQIDKKIQEDPTFPTAKVTVKRTAKPDNIFYCWTYDGSSVGCEDLRINVNTLMASNGPLAVGNSIKNAFDASQNPNLPKKLRELPQPGLKSTVDNWINSHSQYKSQQAVKK